MISADIYHFLFMYQENFSFDAMPQMMARIFQKLEVLDEKIDALQTRTKKEDEEQWLNLKELCEYLPFHPAEQTVYGWTCSKERQIPFHKVGKNLAFLKSEIDDWLKEGKRKSISEIEKEAETYVASRRRR